MKSLKLKTFESEFGFEYSINLNVVKTRFKGSMFISVTVADEDIEDYTVVFNRLPTLNDLISACDMHEDAAKLIIQRLKEEDVAEYAKKYWNFNEKDKWFDGLDNVLKEYFAELEEEYDGWCD